MKKYPVYSIEQFNCNSVNSDLYVNTFKNHLLNHSFVEKPHRHNFYLLVLFTNGSGVHEVDFDRFAIHSGSAFVLQPGQMHHWVLSEDIEGFIIFYSAEMYNLYFGNKRIEDYPFYFSIQNSPEIVLDEQEIKSVLPYFESLITETQTHKLLQRDKIMNLLDIIHIELARKYNEIHVHETHSYNVKIKNLEQLLEKKYKEEKSAAFYASELNITLKHLNRICNEILKKTTTEVIVDRIMLEAKRMLLDKNWTVNEIAFALGYEDYSYFSRLFKKHTAMTPTNFRLLKKD
ncbi:AraC-type DNA-binding protein [Flavobacterium glycines]|uniref:AraC family transcriptional regulator n=1 Tax=Flavobacterium glycines TaxID=551990 RepID=A0A1B9DRN8_9FLAO|nr:helix-turn-helix domain-containing protein [Flavobacterium glycines]OCB72348.1 AraC family transcriptional regulator [Flavobacterium glycines]GEL09821.1 AraC family transcriptional regulator [Flavobacterium glycines]SDI92334.1 AraC-type DNA-binding protein [Flavobacterium glycines]